MRALLFMTAISFATPVHVDMQGVVTSINVDSLGAAYSDSVGLKVGAKVMYSMDLDYAAKATSTLNGVTDTGLYPDQTDPNDSSSYTHNFRYAFSGTRFTQTLFASPPSVIDDHGDFQHSDYPPTFLELSSIRHWNDSVSWVQFVFQGTNGKLTDSSQGLGQEELLIFQTPLRNASTLLVCAFDITQVTVSAPVALFRANAASTIRPPEMRKRNREALIFPMDKQWFLINGRRE